MRFSLEPFPGDNGFTQWRDAMKMVARLPGGIPTEFRRQLWLTLADRYIVYRQLDWPATCRSCLNERTNPDDDALGVQIVKDLHRTGCSHLTGDNEAAEQNQALLKRVLLAYARFNKHVGYCQGFNLLAALVLQVVEWNEEDALKMMLYLIEGVLPDGYFANDLRGLSVDMAVFRDLLRLRLAALAKHLDKLQLEANDGTAGNNTSSYEPPLTNVFTMQWFLTLFSTCLPPTSVLRVWDLTLLEGNEVLLRTALAIWDGLADRIMAVDSADEFYSIMGVLTREMLEFGLMDCNELVQTIVSMASFPFPQLQELREKYTFDIRPFAHNTTSAHRKSSIRNLVGLRLFDTEEDDDGELDEDQLALASAAWYLNQRHGKANVTLDINTLKRQYAKLRDRQRQAHVILTSTLKTAIEQQAHPDNARSQQRPLGRTRLPVNSLLAGHKPIVRKIRPTSKVQFTMPPDEVTRETNRPRGPRAMRTKIMIDERTDIAKQHQQPQTQHQQQKFSAQGTSPQRGETLTWEQIEREQREKFGSDRVRTRSWSSSTDDSSTTSLCDQSLHDLEGDSSSLCVSPILPASPRSPRLVQSTEIGSSVYQTPATGGCSTSPTVATPHSTDKKAGSSSTGDSPLMETKDSAMHAQDPKQEQPEKIERQNRFVDQPKKALPPDRKPARQAGVNAVEIGLHSYSTLPSIQYASKDTDDRKLSCRSKMPPETEISAKDEVVVAVAMTTQCRPHVVKLPLDSLSKQETIIGKSTPLEVSLSSNTEPIADVGLEETVNRGSSPNKVLPSSGNNGGSSNKTPASDSLRKLIIADAPQSWVTLSEKEDSPSAIVAGPGMWHQIREGSFVGDGETDSVQVIHSQNAIFICVLVLRTKVQAVPWEYTSRKSQARHPHSTNSSNDTQKLPTSLRTPLQDSSHQLPSTQEIHAPLHLEPNRHQLYRSIRSPLNELRRWTTKLHTGSNH
ncbi:uncharacterized protein LOC111267900 isoform X1 [Varroa jacobsoni]|uniref:uncharacterized protein LOC111267900 isoform X1 n=1 Tax=Varroa jacobsoni TaxID=62625 RepID=UPI000BF98DF2|nr:uncharacterized protein LOC111267900 isoform X1 [Varroa jacobsoni]